MDDSKLHPGAVTVNPITLEIIKGALRAAQAETEALLERTAMSDVIREKKDFFTGFFDPDGKLVAATPAPLFAHIVQPIFKYYAAETMRPGDLYWYNDCYASDGGVSHLNDQVFAAPVFVDGKLSAFSQSWAHFTDIGGMPEVIGLSGAGRVVPPGDPGKLAAAIVEFARARNELPDLGRRARSCYRQHFTPERMTENYLALYRACAGMRPEEV